MPVEILTKRAKLSSRRSASSPALHSEPMEMALSHPDKVLYPQSGITKRDLAEFYQHIAEWVLPHVTGRPLNLGAVSSRSSAKMFLSKICLGGSS